MTPTGWGHGENVTIIRRAPAINPYSAATEPGMSSAETRWVIAGCGVAPTAGDEPLAVDTPHRSIADLTVYLPHDPDTDDAVDVLPGDQIEVRGARFEVIGALQRWASPLTGWQPGSVLTARRVEA
ncbi:MAG: hypothetical protein ACRCZP_11755 [Phycicoccus sp.]